MDFQISRREHSRYWDIQSVAVPTGVEVVGKFESKATKACILEGIAH